MFSAIFLSTFLLTIALATAASMVGGHDSVIQAILVITMCAVVLLALIVFGICLFIGTVRDRKERVGWGRTESTPPVRAQQVMSTLTPNAERVIVFED